jgi:hypothetical protein
MVNCVTDLLGTMRRAAAMKSASYSCIDTRSAVEMSTQPGQAPRSNWNSIVSKGKTCPKSG